MTDVGWLTELLNLSEQLGTLSSDEKQRFYTLREKMQRTQHWDAALQFFWQKLATLEDTRYGWELLYDLICRILSVNFPEYNGLSEPRPSYIQGFVIRKIFEPANRLAGTRIHYGALRHYYRNFLRDQIDAEKTTNLPIATEDNAESSISLLDLMMGTQADSSKPAAIAWQSMTTSAPEAEAVLIEAGLTIGEVTTATRKFLDTLATLENDWGRVMLRCSACADKSQCLPMSHFQGVVKNHHYRARQLGVIPGGTQFPDYSATQLGQWLIELGLSLDGRYRDAIETVLKILCWEALSSIEIDCTRHQRESS